MKRCAPTTPRSHEGKGGANLRVLIISLIEIINSTAAFVLVGLGSSAVAVGILVGLVMLGVVDLPEWALVGLAVHPCASCEHLKDLLQHPTPTALLAHGLTPVRLAELLGVSRSTTFRWYQAGRIPESVRYDVARELLAAIHGGGRHDDL